MSTTFLDKNGKSIGDARLCDVWDRRIEEKGIPGFIWDLKFIPKADPDLLSLNGGKVEYDVDGYPHIVYMKS